MWEKWIAPKWVYIHRWEHQIAFITAAQSSKGQQQWLSIFLYYLLSAIRTGPAPTSIHPYTYCPHSPFIHFRCSPFFGTSNLYLYSLPCKWLRQMCMQCKCYPRTYGFWLCMGLDKTTSEPKNRYPNKHKPISNMDIDRYIEAFGWWCFLLRNARFPFLCLWPLCGNRLTYRSIEQSMNITIYE